MLLRKATPADYDALCDFYQTVCKSMDESGLFQWEWGKYPSPDLIQSDIARGTLYCVYGEHGVAVAGTVEVDHVKDYEPIHWIFGVKPGVLRRLAVNPKQQGRGLGKQAMNDLEEIMRSLGCDCLRCDTYEENSKALRMYASHGLRTAGRMRLNHRPKQFICFEKPLVESCPMLPINMHPAFRGGKLTPWGGNKLMTVYDKPIRDIPTGESLEVSAISSLESTDDSGMRLTDMIKRYGSKLVGSYDLKTFPLLLKLIDAKQSLSVQVHPDDAYAHDNERGKLGKNEAWMILDTPDEGGELVYGIQPGTTLEQLQAACEAGAAVESLLRRVSVKPGDVCYIPAGCVHAIGAGITLYEIQQSSDITYRFYDWGRVDANGKSRELHLEKALAVTDLSFQPDPIPAPSAPLARVLDTPYFTLDLFNVTDAPVDVPAVNQFGMLTALDQGLTLCWEGLSRQMNKGDTLLIPATAPALTLTGCGRAALSMPR